MGFVYPVVLLATLGCMLLLDRRFRLFFWRDAVSASVVTAVGLAFFLVWDVAGIAGGISVSYTHLTLPTTPYV